MLKNNSKNLSWNKFWKLNRYKTNFYSKRFLLDQNGNGKGAGYISLINLKNSQKKVRKILNILSNESILDYGSGNCVFSSYFLRNNKNKVYCYDINKRSLLIGKLIFKKIIILRNNEIKKNLYDHIICSSVFQYLSLKEAKKVINFFYKISKKTFFIIDISNFDTKKAHLKFRKKFKFSNSIYKLPNHTYYKKSFFTSFAKKKFLSVKFFNNVLMNKQQKFRFSVLFKKI